MKNFVTRFSTTCGYGVVSFSRKSMALRWDNTEVKLTEEQLDEVIKDWRMDDISYAIGLVRKEQSKFYN